MKWITWPGLDRFHDVGLLILRVGLGVMFIGHGWPKLTGGPERWERLGGAMGSLGIDFAPTFWGFMAAFAEVVGGGLLIIGLASRPAAAMLAFTMLVAAANHYVKGDGFRGWSHATEACIAFTALMILGPGRYAADARLKKR